MAKYRKRPVVIEAVQWDPDDSGVPLNAWPIEWPASGWSTTNERVGPRVWDLLIPTLEGTMTAQPGDWVIRGVNGEYYPCKPDIFAATYEPVPDPQPQAEGGDALAEMIAAEDKTKKRRERRREREQNDLDYVEGGDATESAAAEQNKRGGPVQVAAGAGAEVKAPVPAQPVCDVCGREKWRPNMPNEEAIEASCDKESCHISQYDDGAECYRVGYERLKAAAPSPAALAKLRAALEAGQRLSDDAYSYWVPAAPNQCAHGRLAGDCRTCDHAAVCDPEALAALDAMEKP